MARTDRSSGGAPASAAAMDELNLDDLFLGGGGGGGEDLFGGLDEIDLDGFDEISSVGGGGSATKRRGGGGGGSGSGTPRGAAAAFDGLGLDFDLSSGTSIGRPPSASPPPPAAAAAAAAAAQPKKKSQRKKRKTKKMLASEGEGDDSDEDCIPGGGGSSPSTTKAASKGKARAKSGTRKKKADTVAGVEADSPIVPTASRGKTKVSSSKGKARTKKGRGLSTASASASPLVQPFGSSPMMPPPLPRPPGAGGVNVAALPKHLQGSAVFASGQLSSPPVKSPLPQAEVKEAEVKEAKPIKSKKRKSSKADEIAAAAAAPSPSPSDLNADPTDCGLTPNSDTFYPFMPLPTEVAMRRMHRAFPALDKLHSHLAHISDGESQPKGNDVGGGILPKMNGGSASDNNPLFRLFADHLGALETSRAKTPKASKATAASADGSVSSGPGDVDANVHKHLDEARKMISLTEKSKLRREVMNSLLLVRRQATFLGTSLSNMEAWCKQHMSEEEYSEGFMDEALVRDGSAKISKRGRSGSIGRDSRPILPVVASMDPVFVKIRIKCKGFREPASITAKLGGGPLVAQLPVPPGVARAAAAGGTTPTSKRRRKSTSTAPSTAGTMPSVPYEYLSQPERRRLVARAISTQAYDLEIRQKKVKDKREASRQECASKIDQVIKDDPVQVCHTTTLWQIMKHSPYLSHLTEEDIREGLAEAWQPELGSREMHWGEIPPIRIQRNRPSSRKRKRETKEAGEIGENKAAPAQSKLFDRLQSLLVDIEEGEDDADMGDSSIETGQSDMPKNNKALIYASDPRTKPPLSALTKGHGETLLDLSKFTLDQRAYIQLRALGLADVPLLPPVQPIIEEEAASVVSTLPQADSFIADRIHSISNGENKTAASASAAVIKSNGQPLAQDDDLDSIVRRMQADLSDMHRSNNIRAAFLQAASMEQMYEHRRAKRREEENSSLIAKHAQLIKKQKEAQNKKAPKPKASKDEGWLPW